MGNIDIKSEQGAPESARGCILIISIFEKTGSVPAEYKKLDEKIDGALGRILKAKDFSGKHGQTSWLYPKGAGFSRLLLLGVGPKDKFSTEMYRRAIGVAAREAKKADCADAVVQLHSAYPSLAKAAVEGFMLGAYQFDKYKSKTEAKGAITKLTIRSGADANAFSKIRAAIEKGKIISESVVLARDLANAPGNDLPPAELAKAAQEQARKWGLKCKVLDEKELKKNGMNAILAVGGGSSRPPRLIVVEYSPKGVNAKKPPLIFVGKGITFDSGGISLKPAENMDQMKYDMSGAAAALALTIIAKRCAWSRPVVGIMPCAENLPGSTAYRPGDIIATSSGIKIEVLNTDAEGRVLLSDALNYAKKFKPAAVVDIATLTGACAIALGAEAIGLLSKDDDLAKKLFDAGQSSGERAWQLPLWDEYFEQIKSDFADVKNTGGRAAGTITAAAFLHKFTAGYRWAHLDIAGTAWSERDISYKPRGATGASVRLLAEFGETF